MVDLGTCKQLRPWEEHLCQQQGTIPYFAPEVFASKQSLKSDAWSAGCLVRTGPSALGLQLILYWQTYCWRRVVVSETQPTA